MTNKVVCITYWSNNRAALDTIGLKPFVFSQRNVTTGVKCFFFLIII